MKIAKWVLGFIILAGVGFYLTDGGDVEFRSNNYGLSEVRIADSTFYISDKYDDGPYVFYKQSDFSSQSVVAGKLTTETLPANAFPEQFLPEASIFTDVSKIAALSDIHGQHDVFIQIMKNNRIVDENLNWSFSDGHFVVVGDVFDRGPQVLDTLWFLYELEKQAERVGGKVHFLLGNHEYMVLQGRLRYLHGNYLKTAALMGRDYNELFADNSVLGRWIRSKATMIKINQSLFVHGGVSENFLTHDLDLQTINLNYRKTLDMSKDAIKQDPTLSMLHDRQSPIWYRGYIMEELSNATLDKILDFYDAERIVIGHTSLDQVSSFYQGRVIDVDSSIKEGKQGGILIINDQGLFAGDMNGLLKAI